MDTEYKVLQQVNRWITDSKFIIQELENLDDKITETKKADQTTLVQQQKEKMAEAEKMIKEVTVFVEDCYIQLKSISEPRATARAAADILRAGSLLLSNPPDTIKTIDFLYGMWFFFVQVNFALAGEYSSPVLSLYGMNLQEKTKELLFFYNGVATLGDLMHSIQTRRNLINITPARILECQTILISLGYSIQPKTEKRQYWAEVHPGSGLWTCTVEGKSNYFIEVNAQQEETLLKFACVNRLPYGQMVAKLSV